MQTLSIVIDSLPYILGGSFVTIGIVVIALSIGLMLGLPMAVGLVYGGKIVKTLIWLYVGFFRGVPILVLLFLFYFGLFVSMNLQIEAFSASCIVLGLTSAAYQAQIFKGAILSVSQGQLKAAKALGMSNFQAIRNIVLPQAMRFAIPGWTNEYSILIKDSAICFVLGTQEIMARTYFIASRTHEHLLLYTIAGVIYFMITYVGIRYLRKLENKLYVPGFAGMKGINA